MLIKNIIHAIYRIAYRIQVSNYDPKESAREHAVGISTFVVVFYSYPVIYFILRLVTLKTSLLFPLMYGFVVYFITRNQIKSILKEVTNAKSMYNKSSRLFVIVIGLILVLSPVFFVYSIELLKKIYFH
ncbi:hypothetical protein GCM10027348_24820 [Hymenobacter tenuis]